jgi:hypothetical protein
MAQLAGAGLNPAAILSRTNPHKARRTGVLHDSRVPSLEAFRRRPWCLPNRRDGPASETLVWGFGCQGRFFLVLRERRRSFVCLRRLSLRPSAANPPFFCSTAPQAFFRPDHGFAAAVARRRCQGWPRSGHRRPGLYIGEHGGMLVASGRLLFLLFLALDSSEYGPGSRWLGSRHRGEPASRRERSRRQPCIRWISWIRTMMHTCASAARLRGGGPNLHNGMRAMVFTGPRHLEPSSAVH